MLQTLMEGHSMLLCLKKAAFAYDCAAFRIHGAKDLLNFPLAFAENAEYGPAVDHMVHKRKRKNGGGAAGMES